VVRDTGALQAWRGGRACEGGGEPVEAQDIKLMLPSQVLSTCSLLKYEWQLRYSQALDFLADIRHLLLRPSQL
jgi:hypothetical protein